MAWTNWGFDGTINEAQWAQMAGLLGNGYVAAGNGDCLVTAVGGSRAVSVAAGTLYGDGVVSVNSGAETVAMTTPVNGQWYVIALRRTWATNTAALVAIAGATTTTTTPTAPPTSFPTLNTNVGVLTDQPIAWAWCNSANTTVVVYDIRLKAVKSLPSVVATQAERDAKFMSPTQGLQVWRDDLGAVETYYGLYNASTNPGGRDTAGWYVSNRASGLVPIKPSTVTVTTGTATQNGMGEISFVGATALRLDSIFTSAFRHYRIVISITGDTGSPYDELRLRYTSGGTQNTAASYAQFWFLSRLSGATGTNNGSANQQVGLTRVVSQTNAFSTVDMIVLNPAIAKPTVGVLQGTGYDATSSFGITAQTIHDSTSTFDGIYLFNISGTMTGTVSIYGVVN